MNTLPRGLSVVAGLVLLATALLHATGTSDVRAVLTAGNVQGFFADALPVIWMFFSWHLAAMAVLILWAAATNPHWFLPVSVFGGLVAVGDYFWVFSAAGWFAGSVALLVAASALVTASVLLGRTRPGGEAATGAAHY